MKNFKYYPDNTFIKFRDTELEFITLSGKVKKGIIEFSKGYHWLPESGYVKAMTVPVKLYPTLLWIDDLRNPFDVKWNTPDVEIHWVKSLPEFVLWIEEHDLPDIISFDHDLGEENTNGSGYDCAKELVEYCYRFSKPLPEFRCHSANPVGRENILGLLNNARKHFSI